MVKNVTIYNNVNITTSIESIDMSGSLISVIENPRFTFDYGDFYSGNPDDVILEKEITTGLLKKAGVSLSFIYVYDGLRISIIYDRSYEAQINKCKYELYLDNDINPRNGWYISSKSPGKLEFEWGDAPWIYDIFSDKRLELKIVSV